MRDGNLSRRKIVFASGEVVSLPMRDGNSPSTRASRYAGTVVSLPMRDGNTPVEARDAWGK